MTQREFYEAIVSVEGLDKELVDFAENGIAKLDARNEARRGKPSKNAEMNAPIKEAIVSILAEADTPMLCADILAKLGGDYTMQKVNGLCGTLVKEGRLSKALQEGVAKSKAKVVYSIAD